jgi:GntR family transcriptional regulator, transcriptional repressor for pyruvate dehydrogenase complex
MPQNRAVARTASESVAEQIRAQIATGALKPGDMLPSETALLEIYSVARPTMREALRILESDGLVSILRGINGGAQVREPDLATLARRAGLHLQLRGTHLEALTEAQRLIQPGAVALAAVRRDPADLARLRSCVDSIAECDDLERYGDLAADFLRLLIEASGNQILSLFSGLIDQLLHDELRRWLLTNALDQKSELLTFAVWREHLRMTTHPAALELPPERLEVYPARHRGRTKTQSKA